MESFKIKIAKVCGVSLAVSALYTGTRYLIYNYTMFKPDPHSMAYTGDMIIRMEFDQYWESWSLAIPITGLEVLIIASVLCYLRQ